MKAALPYPLGLTIKVFSDDGKWGSYSHWGCRSSQDLNKLYVTTITLAHFEGEDEPCYTMAQWCDKAKRLIAEYPNCQFVYSSNG